MSETSKASERDAVFRELTAKAVGDPEGAAALLGRALAAYAGYDVEECQTLALMLRLSLEDMLLLARIYGRMGAYRKHGVRTDWRGELGFLHGLPETGKFLWENFSN